MRRSVLLLLAAVLIPAMLPPAADAGEPPAYSPDEVRAIALAVTSDRSYQKEIVKAPIEEEFKPHTDDASPRGEGSVFLTLLYVVIGVAVALSLLWAGMYIRDMVQARSAAQAVALPTADGDERRDPHMTEIDRLAGTGRYGDAVHKLLLLTVSRLSAVCGRPVADALTSRELARRLPRSEEERDFFELLVKAVEVSFFGNRPVDHNAFIDCREAFRKLAP